MKRAILTGATGFVGANLARRLLQDGHEVHLLVRKNYRSWRIDSILEDVRLHEVDLNDEGSLSQKVSKIKPDWVFHLATHGAYSSQKNLRQILQTNIIGTLNLVEACLKSGFEVFINTGSSSEYGFKDRAATETEWLEPNSHYAWSKASATLFCRHTAQSQGVRIPTLRLYSVYGAYEESTRLMPTLILRGLQGELPPLVNPNIARDYIYIDDVLDAYLLTATVSDRELGAVYNLGTGIQTSLRDVVEVACTTLALEVEPQWGSMPNRDWDTNVWVADNRKIQATFNWRPQHSFESGFRLMVDWFRDNPKYQTLYRKVKNN